MSHAITCTDDSLVAYSNVWFALHGIVGFKLWLSPCLLQNVFHSSGVDALMMMAYDYARTYVTAEENHIFARHYCEPTISWVGCTHFFWVVVQCL